MGCATCGKPISAQGNVEYRGYSFCDNLCRYSFRKREEEGTAVAAPPRVGSSAASATALLTAPRWTASVTHAAMAATFCFLVITRYLIHLSPPQPVSLMQEIGANFAYLTIWATAYRLTLTSPRRMLALAFGLAALFGGLMIMPLVGFVLLINMYFLRRADLRRAQLG